MLYVYLYCKAQTCPLLTLGIKITVDIVTYAVVFVLLVYIIASKCGVVQPLWNP